MFGFESFLNNEPRIGFQIFNHMVITLAQRKESVQNTPSIFLRSIKFSGNEWRTNARKWKQVNTNAHKWKQMNTSEHK